MMRRAIVAVLFLAGLFLMSSDSICVVLVGLACMVPGIIASNIPQKMHPVLGGINRGA